MFSWFTKRPRTPPQAAANPGDGHLINVAFSNSDRTWSESGDLTVLLANTMRAQGIEVVAKQEWVKTQDGFIFLPQVASIQPRENSGVRTTSTIQVSHDTLIPDGLFEYQHSTGDDVRDSFTKGFESWVELDLTPLRDSLKPKPDGMSLVMDPKREGTSLLKRDRRVVFGPPLQMTQRAVIGPQEHDFCPCCLFTNSLTAFEKLVNTSAFYGIRLYAMRTKEGEIEADCRVNGEDFPEGAAGLARYAASWPDRGFEYRKQYVCVQTLAEAPK